MSLQNRRPDYISIFMDKLVSWEAVGHRLEVAKALAVEREKEEERKKREEEEKTTDDQGVKMYVENDGDDSESD